MIPIKYIVVLAVVATLLAAGWRLFAMGEELAAARATTRATEAALLEERVTNRNLESAIAALAQSNGNVSQLLERTERDIATLRSIPDTGRCGPPVHAAIDMLRDSETAEGERPPGS